MVTNCIFFRSECFLFQTNYKTFQQNSMLTKVFAWSHTNRMGSGSLVEEADRWLFHWFLQNKNTKVGVKRSQSVIYLQKVHGSYESKWNQLKKIWTVRKKTKPEQKLINRFNFDFFTTHSVRESFLFSNKSAKKSLRELVKNYENIIRKIIKK